MKLFIEDLQFWSVTTGREPWISAYKRAQQILDDGKMPVIIWHDDSTFVEVKKGRDLTEDDDVKFKKFKQSNRTTRKMRNKKKK